MDTTTMPEGGFWRAALIWGAVAAVLVWVLARTVRRAPLEQVRWAVPVAAALFWGIFVPCSSTGCGQPITSTSTAAACG